MPAASRRRGGRRAARVSEAERRERGEKARRQGAGEARKRMGLGFRGGRPWGMYMPPPLPTASWAGPMASRPEYRAAIGPGC